MTWAAILLLLLAALVAAPFLRERMRRPMDPKARTDAPGEFADLSQGVTHYRWIGPLRGPVLVCVHGLTTPSFVWDELAEGLADLGYRVLVYDLFGRGYSDRPQGRQDRGFFLRQLEDLLDDQEVGDDITMVGYSMGGAIATAFASEHPDRMRHLVLLAPAGTGPGPAAAKGVVGFITRVPVIGDWLMLALFPARHRAGIAAETRRYNVPAGIAEKQRAELSYRGFLPAVLSSMRGALSEDYAEDHRAIHSAGIPVLAIWGREDDVIPLSCMGRLTQWSRGARQDVIDDAGHGLTYTHAPAVLAILKQALREGIAP